MDVRILGEESEIFIYHMKLTAFVKFIGHAFLLIGNSLSHDRTNFRLLLKNFDVHKLRRVVIARIPKSCDYTRKKLACLPWPLSSVLIVIPIHGYTFYSGGYNDFQ